MKIATLAGAVVLTAALAVPALAEAGSYCARRHGYRAYYVPAPYPVYRYRYVAPYRYYGYPPYPYVYRRVYVPPRPAYVYPYARPRVHVGFGVWW